MCGRAALLPCAQFRPHGLARGCLARADAPVVRESGDEVEAAAGLGCGVEGRGSRRGLFLGSGVGYLDAEGVLDQGEPDAEVPPGDVTVPHGVGGEFRRDEGERLVDRGCVGVPPVVQAMRDESAGETGSARRRGEAHGELVLSRGVLRHMPVRGSC